MNEHDRRVRRETLDDVLLKVIDLRTYGGSPAEQLEHLEGYLRKQTAQAPPGTPKEVQGE